VEHYFSDFLSCLESRIMKENGRIEQEALKLHNYSGYIETSDIYYDLVPEKLDLPLNLYVTGTVNIDETTYAFSPKVLDRANVIEFNEVSVSRYTEPDTEDVFKLKKFPSFGVAKLALSDDYNKTPPKFQDVVKELLDILQPYNLHFGYRVINEMALFVNNSIEHIDDSEPVLLQAIDIQINQKILP